MKITALLVIDNVGFLYCTYSKNSWPCGRSSCTLKNKIKLYNVPTIIVSTCMIMLALVNEPHCTPIHHCLYDCTVIHFVAATSYMAIEHVRYADLLSCHQAADSIDLLQLSDDGEEG